MGLAWQQGPLATTAIGRFLVPGPLPERLLHAEPLRRRMRARLADTWVADSEDVVPLHEPGQSVIRTASTATSASVRHLRAAAYD
jgi:hypothetical protein